VQAQASAGELQDPGAGGTHTPQATASGADGRGSPGILHDLTAAAAKPHENFADFTAMTDLTHAGGVHDLMQVQHMHFAHMWAG